MHIYVFSALQLFLGFVLLMTYLVCAHGPLSEAAYSKDKGQKATAIQATLQTMTSRFFSLARQGVSTMPRRLELTVIIPSTSSVGPQSFSKLKTFTQDLTREFSVQPSGTRISLVIHASAPILAFSAYHFVNLECTLKGISSVSYHPGNASSWKDILSFIKSTIAENHLRDVKKVVFIVAEAPFTVGKQASLLAKSLHDAGVEVFVLTVGSHMTNNEPNMVASKPIKSHVLRVGTFQDLSTLSKAFRGKGFNRSCNGNSIVYDECLRRCRCKNGQRIDCYRIRKDFTEMSIEERRRYVRAFKSASTVAPYKSTYERITKLHPKYFEPIHEKEFFFPWHRWYLLVFENLLRHVDCRVTVPFWNWARAVSHKKMWRQTNIRDFWYPGSHGLGGNGELQTGCVQSGPFKKGKWSLPSWLGSDCLAREFDFKYFLPGEWYVNDLLKLSLSKFNKFESGVRDYMHNDLHNAIGGTMSLDESAVTPEFWSHHAFLDKIWSDWQDHGTAYKFYYYRTVKKKLPGGNHYGWEFMDLQKQPHCVKVQYQGTPDKNAPNVTYDQKLSYGPRDGEDYDEKLDTFDADDEKDLDNDEDDKYDDKNTKNDEEDNDNDN